jgi:acyl-CoA reductase-like NAD-dependent aldehyde dehydrogenase
MARLATLVWEADRKEAQMEQYGQVIDGNTHVSGHMFGVTNPATGSVFAQAPECSREHLDLAIESAHRAFSSWREDETVRRAALSACADSLRANAGALGEILTREQGKTLEQATGEVEWSAWWIDEILTLEIPVDVILDDENERVEMQRRPLGVIGAITPWNFPIVVAISKIAPALLVGNTMVLKPSQYTPLSSLQIGELFSRILPPGVLNVISGGDELGAWMTSSPNFAKVSFTGSVETGRKVAESTASNLGRTTLELGGNDAAIVLPDVDLPEIAGDIFSAAFSQNGQACVAIKRLYVHEEIYKDMVAELQTHAEGVKPGDGTDPNVTVGPIANRAQLERVEELVGDAKAHGATVVTGGQRLDRTGYFFPPTIVTNIADGVRLVDEEQFGPVLPVIPFNDVHEVDERANRTDFGLGGSVWTSDVALGIELASRLECGSAGVNQHIGFHPLIPFGGAKHSGRGIQNGLPGLDELSQIQVVAIKK